MMTDNSILLTVIFFVYGLAFFTMGLAIALESRRSSDLPLAVGLKYLAAFGLLLSVVQWIDMLVLIQNQLTIAPQDMPWRVIKVILLATSTVCLLVFGARVFTETHRRHYWLRMVPAGLFLIWLGSFVVPHLGWIAGEPANGGATCVQCHWGRLSTYLTLSGEWVTSADVWANYLLYFPGSILAALALYSQGSILKHLGLPKITVDCHRAAAAFAANSVISALIVPPAPYFPASVLNYATFYDWVHVPPQVFRGLLAFLIAYHLVRILRIFEIEQHRRLEAADRQRFEAQRATLEAQRKAHEDMQRWSKELEETVRQRTKELEALYNIGTKISALKDIDQILESVVDSARQLLGVEVATLSLLDDQSGELVVRAASGTRTNAFSQIRMRVGVGVAGRAVELRKPVAVADYAIEPSITHELDEIVEAEGLSCHLAVPLNVGDKMVGALYVADRRPLSLSDSDARLLARLANQASIAIENVRLYERVQNLAVIEERDRLAREMHDSLAQALGYLSLKSSVVSELLSKGNLDSAIVELRHMERAADDAYADVRESILGLRSTISPERGLAGTLTEYLHKFGLQNGIHTEIAVEDGLMMAFSPNVEIQVVRIIQEALTNVRKHAGAAKVWMRCKRIAGQVVIEIVDDGRGFEPAEVDARHGDHFGLQSMRERAESIGGKLCVQSRPGAGTEVCLRLPKADKGGYS